MRTLVYVLCIGALFSLAGLMAETLCGFGRRSQRWIWLGCLVLSLAAPFGVTSWMEGSDTLAAYQQLTLPDWSPSWPTTTLGGAAPAAPAMSAPAMGAASGAGAATAADRHAVVSALDALSGRLPQIAAASWLLASIAMLGMVTRSFVVLGKQLRRLEPANLCGTEVRVSDSWGPAVIGLRTSQIVVPRWLLSASASVQRATVVHEREHIRAHDARLLFAGVLLVALMPWNLALWWQLRRLRFAIEKDCDQRVIARGFEATDYSRALLAVARAHVVSPLGAVAVGAVALGERATQLEKRIARMLRARSRHRLAWGAAATLALLGCLAMAAEIPPPSAPPPLWPDTTEQNPFYAKALMAAHQRYPQLLSGKFDGTVVIDVDLAPNGTVTGTRTYSCPAGPLDTDAPSCPEGDTGWAEMLRSAEEGIKFQFGLSAAAGDTHFLDWYGASGRNGLYLEYQVYFWPRDVERSPLRALQLVDAVHPDFIQAACRTIAKAPAQSHPKKALTVLFRDDGSIARESWTGLGGTNMPENTAQHWKSLGYDPRTLAHWGIAPTLLHGYPAGCFAPAGTLYYAWLKRPSASVVDFAADRQLLGPLIAKARRETEDAPKQAQRLFEHYFPEVWSSGPHSHNQFVLLLLNRTGRVIFHEQGSPPGTAGVNFINLLQNGVLGHRAHLVIATGGRCRDGRHVEVVVARVSEDDLPH